MKPSYNTLVIESINSLPVNKGDYFTFESTLNAHVLVQCSINGNILRRIVIKSQFSSSSKQEALRMCIELFVNKKYEFDTEYYDKPTESFFCNEIHALFVNIPEPFKSMFEQLFSKQKENILL